MKKRLGFWAYFAIVCGIIVALLIAVAGTIYVQRRSVLALLAQNYLRTRGVDSEVSFSALSMGGFLARVRAGTVDQPDFTADSMEVTFVYPNDGMTPGIAAVKLVRPFLRVGYDGKTLSFGSLQMLIDEALAQAPEGEGPAVSIEKGDVLLVTPNGNLRFTVDLEIANRRVLHVNAVVQAGRLQGEGIAGVFSGGTLKADAQGEVLNGSATLKLDSLTYEASIAREVDLAGNIRGLKWEAVGAVTRFQFTDGTLTLRSGESNAATLALTSAQTNIAVQSVAGEVTDGRMTARAKGVVDVQLEKARFADVLATAQFTEHMVLETAEIALRDDDIRIAAQGTSHVEVTEARAGTTSLARLTAETVLPDVKAIIAGGIVSLEGSPRIALAGAGLRYSVAGGTISAPQFRADVAAQGALRDGKPEGVAQASLSGRANIPRAIILPYVQNVGDPALAAALASAAQSVALQTRAITVRMGDEIAVTSGAPIVLDGMNGAKITISPRGSAPLLAMAGANITGALSLGIGGGLPRSTLTLSSYRYAPNRFDAETEFETAADLAYLPGLRASGRGRLQTGGNRTTFELRGCAELGFASLSLQGTAYIRDVAGQVCAAPPQPLFVSDAGGWRVEARLDEAAAKLEAAGAALANGEGRIQLAGRNAGPESGRVEIAQAELTDLATPVRFLPIAGSGALVLAGGEWRGDVAIASGERKVATIAVRHAMATGTGSAAIDARNLAFAPNQLQPADILPFTSVFGTRVAGTANFTGRIGWSKDGITSDGRLTAAGLGLQTAFGGVRGASFDLTLTSLIPVAMAPKQAITVQSINLFVPITNLAAEFTYTPETFRLDSASAAVAQGRIVLDPVAYDFTTGWTTRGILHLENLNAEPLIEAAGLTGRVTANARISGDVPFALTAEGFRFDNGHIAATAPGRISIKREALTGGVGVGTANQVPPNAVQDFAYQALENMAFDAMEGDISSRPMGRLGMVFRIRGRNDPPATLETRVGVVELLRGQAFDKPLPLPKGTPVDLTLDTSLNLDELLKSYFAGATPSS